MERPSGTSKRGKFKGLEQCLYMGNMSALRDWGHAKDYVRMQWMILQQGTPQDYVIATGVQYSVRQFIEKAAAQLGVTIEFKGEGEAEQAIVTAITGEAAPALRLGQCIVKIDPRYYRPTEVETLLGDPAKANLGRVPEITLDDMVKEMVAHDLQKAKQHALLKHNGYHVSVSVE